MNKIIIGITGQIGSGKTTATNELIKQGFHELAFATPLKDFLSDLFMLDRSKMNDQKYKNTIDLRWGKSPRELMQLCGTNFVREMIHPDFWVMRLAAELLKSKYKKIVISDVRFSNEAQLIRQHGFLFHIKRVDNPYKKVGIKNHKSEQVLEIAYNDFIIRNIKLENFKRDVKQTADMITNRKRRINERQNCKTN